MITLPTPGEAIPTGNIQTGSFYPTRTTDNMPGFPLSQGSRGEYVKNMQRALNDRFGTALVVDGIFGPKTYKAVSANGFEADAVTYAEYMEILGQAW
jgi:peptidoglycan hydrolase-like protein with peptidoglycan-binding domain